MKSLKLSLRGNLLLMGIIPILLFCLTTVYALYNINVLQEKINYAYNVRAKLITLVGNMSASTHAVGRWAWITYGFQGNNEKQKEFIKFSKQEIINFNSSMEEYLKLPRNEKAKEKFKTIEEKWPKVSMAMTEAIAHFEKFTPEENELAKVILQKQLAPNLVPMTLAFNELNVIMNDVITSEIIKTESEVTIIKEILISIGVAVALGLMIFVNMFSNLLVTTFSRISTSLKQSSEEVSSASLQIASSSEQLSQATIEQAASLQETCASIEEVSAIVGNNTEHAQQVSSISTINLQKTEQGKEVVTHMMSAITEINESNAEIAKQIDRTNNEFQNIIQIINEIGAKTKVINEIVFQTKLLSFNASVEAARAGENGKGFAVVAEEVGNLAQMSGNAAKEITDLLVTSTATVEELVARSKSQIGALITSGQEKVAVGTKTAQECEEVFNEIFSSTKEISMAISEIANAGLEQAKGIDEINKATVMLDQVTTQNSANATESASAANSLSEQAKQLDDLVLELSNIVTGNKKVDRTQYVSGNKKAVQLAA